MRYLKHIKKEEIIPYVNKNIRPKLDEIVNLMIANGIKANGDLNYILYKFCKYNVLPSYNGYKNFIGELNECATEIRRRLLADYEDSKIHNPENGDV
jgi:hypothetical protein